MSLAPGVRLGPYTIEALLGEGGMGEVYRARDSRLERAVALKLLPAAVSSDPDRLARFEREAKLLAALNHPNIAHVYGFEQASSPSGQDAHVLAMELVEGEDLARRLERGPIAQGEALAVARQIAEALDAAHEKGIVHRDLKPANVKLTPDGRVKILDFGLAKMGATDGQTAAAAGSESPTLDAPLTRAGAVFGTPAYMSPEQARGLPVDKRADVWAFGCLLFEMLAGRRPFEGHTTTDALAAILSADPQWHLLPPATPEWLRRLLRRCLEKDARRRLRDIGDALAEMDDPSDARGDALEPGPTPPRLRRRHQLVLALALLLAGIALALAWRRVGALQSGAPATLRTTIVLPRGQKLYSGDATYALALSSDGRRLAYVGEQEGGTQLWVRELSSLESKPLAGTAGAMHPFFSPDGEWIGYFAGGALQKVAASGGAPLRICTVKARSLGASWGRDDRIVFALWGSGLHVVEARGGEPRRIGSLADARWPEILPDGRTVLFTTQRAFATMSIDGSSFRVAATTTDSPLDGPAVLGTGTLAQARYLPTGHIVFGQAPGIVRAASFDPASARLTGPVASVVQSVERARNAGAVYFAVASTGALVYATTGYRHRLVWVDRSGAASPISADRAAFRSPRLSPDGAQLAVAVNDETRRGDVWVYDLRTGTKRRLTREHHNGWPVWTPDGRFVTFTTAGGIAEVPADGSATPHVLLARPDGNPRYPMSWSPDGRELLFEVEEATGTDLSVLRRGGEARTLLAEPYNETNGAISPDGRFVAYVSDESGRTEVYVASYPGFGDRTGISADAGTHPRWSRDGREIFFRQGDALLAASVDTKRAFRAERPRRLFSGAYDGEGRHGAYDVAPDGRRFVMVEDDEASALRELTLVQGWFEELRRLAPPSR